jgi:endogenous inhibitor of DNA gyrase (YacG/DUF329 family)
MPKVTRICESCGSDVTRWPSAFRTPRTFCSKSCKARVFAEKPVGSTRIHKGTGYVLVKCADLEWAI